MFSRFRFLKSLKFWIWAVCSFCALLAVGYGLGCIDESLEDDSDLIVTPNTAYVEDSDNLAIELQESSDLISYKNNGFYFNLGSKFFNYSHTLDSSEIDPAVVAFHSDNKKALSLLQKGLQHKSLIQVDVHFEADIHTLLEILILNCYLNFQAGDQDKTQQSINHLNSFATAFFNSPTSGTYHFSALAHEAHHVTLYFINKYVDSYATDTESLKTINSLWTPRNHRLKSDTIKSIKYQYTHTKEVFLNPERLTRMLMTYGEDLELSSYTFHPNRTININAKHIRKSIQSLDKLHYVNNQEQESG